MMKNSTIIKSIIQKRFETEEMIITKKLKKIFSIRLL